MKKSIYGSLLLPLFFTSAVIVIIVALLGANFMKDSIEVVKTTSKNQMVALSEAAARLIPIEEIDKIVTIEDMFSDDYIHIKQVLDNFATKVGIQFAYFIRYREDIDQLVFIADNIPLTPEVFGLPPGTPPKDIMRHLVASDNLEVSRYTVGLHWDPIARDGVPADLYDGKAAATDIGSYSEGEVDWNGLLSAFCPVPQADGSPSRIFAGVDMKDTFITEAQRQSNTLGIILIGAVLVVLLACAANLILFRMQARQARIASQAKGAFLSRMSHEMRTPLNAITGLCTIASEKDDPGEIKEQLDIIKLSSQHLRNIVDDVLDISKIEAGKLTMELVPTDFHAAMDSISKIMKPQADAKNLTYTMRLDENIPPYLRYDATHTKQIIVNLLSNAIKFTPPGGAITFSVSRLGMTDRKCHLRFAVKDTGIGISPETQARIFKPFEQGDASTTRKYGGTGLGLVIASQLITMMGGIITIHSELEKGSEFAFSLWFPLTDKNDVPQSPDDAALATDDRPFLKDKHVLLVEDNEINTMIAIYALESMGARVDTAENGLAGSDKYIATPDKYAYIFMDIQMPIMDGYQATRRIRESGCPGCGDIPIIAMTANVFKEDRDAAYQAGMNHHIGKPFDLHAIETTLRSLARDNNT